MNRKKFLLSLSGVLVVALIVSVWLFQPKATISTPPATLAKADIPDLESFDELKNLFESDSGHVRLISLLSPT